MKSYYCKTCGCRYVTAMGAERCCAEVAELRTENAKLREALEPVTNAAEWAQALLQTTGDYFAGDEISAPSAGEFIEVLNGLDMAIPPARALLGATSE